MSGPSRLPLEALKHGSRAVSAAVAGATLSAPSGAPSAAPSSQPFGLHAGLQHRTSVAGSSLRPSSANAAASESGRSASGGDQPGGDKGETEKQKKERKQKKNKQAKWRGTGQLGEIMHLPALLSPVRVPRNPIVLCHGLYGFDVRGPFLGLEIHYWAAVMDILRKRLGAEVIIRGVPGTGSIQARAEALHKFLCSPEAGARGKDLNFVGHSMGGLDARHLISNIRPSSEQYRPVSLTTICTPHRGSPFMDWCNANIGIGNDAIEEALREVKRKRRRSDDIPQVAKEDEFQPPPYSLKTPLFVRPKKSGNDSASASSAKDGDDTENAAVTLEEQTETSEKIIQKAKELNPLNALASDSATNEEKGRSNATKKSKKEPESKASAILDSIGSAFSTLTGQLSDYMLSLLDTPAYAMLSTKYMGQVFNPSTPDDPSVKYYSIAARTRSIPIWHPLWLPKLILDGAAESRTSGGEADGSGDALGGRMQGNDGLVSVQSAQWGEFLGIVDGCDHWDLRGGGGPRLAEGKMDTAAGSPAAPTASKKGEGEDKGWIDVHQLLGLWRALKPSGNDKGSSDVSGRTAAEGVSSAHGIATMSSAQQEHQQSRPAVSIEALRPASTSAPTPAAEPSTNSKADVKPQESKPADEGDGHGESVSEIVQTFMHAYSHLADPKHEESDYDWTAAPSFTPTSDQESIITEIAHWISDRLPQRDEERRAAAEKEAAAQDRESAAQEQEHVQALEALEAKWSDVSARMSGGQPDTPSPAATASESDSKADSAPLKSAEAERGVLQGVTETISSAVVGAIPAVLTRADAGATQGSPAYRIRHKDEEEDADEDEEQDEAGRVLRDVDELELFWVAVCHHLYARGL